MKESDLKTRIDSLVSAGSLDTPDGRHSRYLAALSIMTALHGETGSQVKSFMRQCEQVHEKWRPGDIEYGIAHIAEAAITNLKAEIDAGFAGSCAPNVGR